MKTKIGPVQILAVGFDPNAKFEGRIIEEIKRLDEIKTIRLLDLLFVKKDEKTSDLVVLSVQGEELGSIIGSLLGFEFEGEEKNGHKTEVNEDNKNAFGLSTKEIIEIGKSLGPGMAAGILLIEHVWAKKLKEAVRDAGGVPLAEGFLTPEALAKVILEVEDMSETIEKLEKEGSDQDMNRAFI